jgi:hypothetical protein
MPDEGQVCLKIKILIAGFRICISKTREQHILVEKTDVKCCVQKDTGIKTSQAYTETVEPVSSTD